MSSGSDRVTPRSSGERLRIGVSACLLGQPVRYNGGHLADGFLLSTLAPHVDWVPVCPEVEVGMGTPREPVRLVGEAGAERMVGVGGTRSARAARSMHRRSNRIRKGR